MAQSFGLRDLPPESRFAAAAIAAGASLEEAAALLRLEPDTTRNHLRRALRVAGVAVPDRAAGDAALAAAVSAAYAQADAAPRPPSRGCPGPDVAAALASGSLDGPLLLAEVEHAADCASCLQRLLALRRAPPSPAAAATPPSRALPALLGALVGLAAAVVYLFA